MCGRFSITGDLDFYAEYFGVDNVIAESLGKSWNVAPTDPVYVVGEKDGERQLGTMNWGLVPHWAANTKTIHINARAETVDTNAAFRDSFATKRCLIPADGFYEREAPEKGRTPHWVYRADGHPMVFAGIWAARIDPKTEDWRRTCSIITTAAEGVIASIHHRMPVSLTSEVWNAWLDRDLTEPAAVRALMLPIDSGILMEHPVSRKVNTVRNNYAGLRDQIEPETLF